MLALARHGDLLPDLRQSRTQRYEDVNKLCNQSVIHPDICLLYPIVLDTYDNFVK